MKESETIKGIMEWIKNRIKELPEEKSVYYKELLLTFKWELKTILERESDSLKSK